MGGSTTLQVLFGLGMGAAACLVVVNGQTPPKPHEFEVAWINENVSGSDNASVRAQPGGRVSVSNNSLRTTGVAMSDLARNLAPFAGRPVVDKTGLSGAFDLDLTWTPEQGKVGPEGTQSQAAPSSDSVFLFTAVREQLGLKLDAQRGPVDVVVIESAKRPVED
jgi:uncharacterized protein (TIGR03435 family)